MPVEIVAEAQAHIEIEIDVELKIGGQDAEQADTGQYRIVGHRGGEAEIEIHECDALPEQEPEYTRWIVEERKLDVCF